MDRKHGNLSVDFNSPKKSRKERIEKMYRNIRIRLCARRYRLLAKGCDGNIDREELASIDSLIGRLQS